MRVTSLNGRRNGGESDDLHRATKKLPQDFRSSAESAMVMALSCGALAHTGHLRGARFDGE